MIYPSKLRKIYTVLSSMSLLKSEKVGFNQHQPTATDISPCRLKSPKYRRLRVNSHKNHKIHRESDMGIHIDHLSRSVVGGGDIFVCDISVLRKSVKSRIKVLCCREKITSAGVIHLGFQALLDILAFEHLNYLFSLDDIPVGSIHAETVYRLIPIIVSHIKRPHYCIKTNAFFGRFNTTKATVRTMQNAGYPQNQTVKLASPVLTAAHGVFNVLLDIIIAVSDILLRCFF